MSHVEPAGPSPYDTVSILLRCPNITHLELSSQPLDLYRAMVAIQALPHHWKDLKHVSLGDVTINAFRFLAGLPKARTLVLNTQRGRFGYNEDCTIENWPADSRALAVTELHLNVADRDEVPPLNQLPNLRTLVLSCYFTDEDRIWVRSGP
jgi:hypothetical protein